MRGGPLSNACALGEVPSGVLVGRASADRGLREWNLYGYVCAAILIPADRQWHRHSLGPRPSEEAASPVDHKRALKLLHTADLHIGEDCWDPCLAREALDGIVRMATAEAVDAVIVAGDLFDSNGPRQEDIDFVVRQLSQLAQLTIILPGNHDPLDEASIYREIGLASQCPNVVLIQRTGGELVNFASLGLTVWGKPVGQSWARRHAR